MVVAFSAVKLLPRNEAYEWLDLTNVVKLKTPHQEMSSTVLTMLDIVRVDVPITGAHLSFRT
ncbi:MAG: hypothetical protein QNJ60_01770 [Xenococcaceae cyanobacterium MO_188.B19]|nr:hypothetical protein [Xenococcaceae cyanobacterium MO_188.B19]